MNKNHIIIAAVALWLLFKFERQAQATQVKASNTLTPDNFYIKPDNGGGFGFGLQGTPYQWTGSGDRGIG